MAVSAKEKKALQEMWEGAKETMEGSLPDGKYQFRITQAAFKVSSSNKPQIASSLEVIGGDEDLLGETLEITDNLETPENMSWFKRKLKRLGIDLPEDFSEIVDGSVCKAMKGMEFEGQAKNKDGFFNIYVNRGLGAGEGGEEPSTEKTTEETDEGNQDEIEKGDLVNFTFKGDIFKGEVLEVLDDMIRIKAEENDKIYKVFKEKVQLIYMEEKGVENTEEPGADKEKKIPTAKECTAMKEKAVKAELERIGVQSSAYKDGKGALALLLVLSKVFYEKEITQKEGLLACKAYGRKPKDTDSPAKLAKVLKAEMDAAILE